MKDLTREKLFLSSPQINWKAFQLRSFSGTSDDFLSTRHSRKAEVKTLNSHTPWKVRWVLRLFLPLPDLPLFSPLKSCEEYAVKSFLLQNPLILFAIRTLALKWIPFSNLEQEFILKDLLLGRQSEENWDCSLWELCPAELVHRSRRRKQRAKQPGA